MARDYIKRYGYRRATYTDPVEAINSVGFYVYWPSVAADLTFNPNRANAKELNAALVLFLIESVDDPGTWRVAAASDAVPELLPKPGTRLPVLAAKQLLDRVLLYLEKNPAPPPAVSPTPSPLVPSSDSPTPTMESPCPPSTPPTSPPR